MVPLVAFSQSTYSSLPGGACSLLGAALPALSLTNFDQESETVAGTKPQWPGLQHQKVKPSREPLTTVTCSINKRLTKNQRPIKYPSPTWTHHLIGVCALKAKGI